MHGEGLDQMVEPFTVLNHMKTNSPPALVLLGLGSNLGNPCELIAGALSQLRSTLGNLRASSLYRSEPVGWTDQPDFLNSVGHAKTSLTAGELLAAVHEVERKLGRTRTSPNAPRTMDIDILVYGDLIVDTPELTLPHPRLHRRAFVLVPLTEIAPDWRHPVFDKTAAELLAEAGPLERIERVGRLPGW